MKQVYEYMATVERVIDGDTVVLSVDLGFKLWMHKLTCRMAKINAPEMKTPEGYPARTALANMVQQAGGPLRMISHGLDKYGRWVVELFAASGASLNDLMVEQGHAAPYMLMEGPDAN